MIYAIIITVISLFVLKKLLGICINALYVGKVGIPPEPPLLAIAMVGNHY